MDTRACSRIACAEPARATLTFDYSAAVAVLGPLSMGRNPHGFDLCTRHAGRTTVPTGWQLIRHASLHPNGKAS
ncbi:MAG: DUF3499 family protein [Cryobacterium sp.]